MLPKLSKTSQHPRLFHSTQHKYALRQKQLPKKQNVPPRNPMRPTAAGDPKTQAPVQAREQREEGPISHVKRNELGVQLLSRKLHEQIFRNVSFPAPNKKYVEIAQEHLRMHGLDPSQGVVLPDTSFVLPPLQGRTLDQHFYSIGASAAQPWLRMANELAGAELPPRPEQWDIQAGWTKYEYFSDGSSCSSHVEFPMHEGRPEQMLVFDVETMPEYSPYAVMACAASKNGWYSWISPWLLDQTEEVRNLIPIGDSTVPRVVVGHNVSYDRGRILEEYSIDPTGTRFLDTMALHVAIKGISSHQRPAWNQYRKSREKEQERKEEAVDAVMELMREGEEKMQEEQDSTKKEELQRLLHEMEESLPLLQAVDFLDTEEEEISTKRWEDLTSANSLADVAKLHCGIIMDKEARNDFMKCTPAEILENVQDYLNYCSNDVAVTHAVFSKTLPAFLTACPSPVSFAGILTMGSSLLTVNEEWENYLANAERTYKELEDKVKQRLLDLAHEAKNMMEGERWRDDIWLSQLDWTPKVAGKSRGVLPDESAATASPAETAPVEPTMSEITELVHSDHIPAWYQELLTLGPLDRIVINRILPLLLKLSFDGYTLHRSTTEGWHYVRDGQPMRLPTAKSKVLTVLGGSHGVPNLQSNRLTSIDRDLAMNISTGDTSSDVAKRVLDLAKRTAELEPSQAVQDSWLQQLNWKMMSHSLDPSGQPAAPKKAKLSTKPKPKPKPPPTLWPKWYWDLARPKKDALPGSLDLTVRNRLAPLLLRLSWQGWPLVHSRQHGWTFRVPLSEGFETRTKALEFADSADGTLHDASARGEYVFYKLPHKDGDKANVGNPLGKTFIKYAQDGTLRSPGDEAKDALDMNAQCSYWISARDRVLNQMVVWQDERVNVGVAQPQDPSKKWGIILPQVITMGAVTRRAIEKTWLTASNAKANRVGSELKAMVRAPEGYAIVGADVDSEELWISSVMGDAQFGLHGATAIGWMTLEGTKAAGTDLHSKTASILGISRDQAKVFNYSRIYGAGMRHAQLLLLQSNAGMLPEQAQKLAQNLYASTKGRNTHRPDLFGRKFWYGGSESFVFNKLEEIALSDQPQTPALGCGITYALSKEYLPATFGADYMPSRINWVVQSSGVDYLHLLIVAMEHLITKYNIHARYLISVHDELRYLVKEEDRYRAALALQIANLWTRSLFAFRLGMDDLPQGVAFFSAVDIDKVLRKEVDMPCVTPSQPVPIPPGESLDIAKVLQKTNGGSLWPDGAPMSEDDKITSGGSFVDYRNPDCLKYRADSVAWLQAQATSDFEEIKILAQQYTGQKGRGGKKSKFTNANGLNRLKKVRALGDGDGVDWTNTIEQLLKSLDIHP
ncbi:hypothetical protein SCP_1402430 [Sparassis crispa]|uniref:Mitochondrial DNA polymerase catalytic subunit n=1 Tax=Sparassis crispa TaxID=139825 RepID=A0A401H320_9APHY|nr:hypothetical protein SCP_1402430 [Sparassis crispa]GBE88836.1 hypothetical protein SCP_1402430 [Sparassis crispa]